LVIGLGFIVGGIAVLVVDGINKNSIVTGPLLMASARRGCCTTSTASAGR